jgi:hypothetical protein
LDPIGDLGEQVADAGDKAENELAPRLLVAIAIVPKLAPLARVDLLLWVDQPFDRLCIDSLPTLGRIFGDPL